MFFRKIVSLGLGLMVSLIAVNGVAQNAANPLIQKSEEAFNSQRWKSAGTLYELLLKDSIHYTPYMAKALLANELAADETSTLRANELFMRNRFRMDSLLQDFSRLCIRLRHFDVFEESLGRMRKVMPENSDTLLYGMAKYRLFLREPQDVIRLAQIGQKEYPGNPTWLHLEANGWQLLGKSEKALPIYQRLLKVNPHDLEALLFEGNYYYLEGKAKMKQLEAEYEAKPALSRIEYAAYRARVQAILDNEFAQATLFLEQANEINPNSTVANTLYEIYVLKSEVEKANKVKRRAK